MLGLITITRISIPCWSVARLARRAQHYLSTLVVVVCCWVHHLKEGTSFIPRYVHGSFWVDERKNWP